MAQSHEESRKPGKKEKVVFIKNVRVGNPLPTLTWSSNINLEGTFSLISIIDPFLRALCAFFGLSCKALYPTVVGKITWKCIYKSINWKKVSKKSRDNNNSFCNQTKSKGHQKFWNYHALHPWQAFCKLPRWKSSKETFTDKIWTVWNLEILEVS